MHILITAGTAKSITSLTIPTPYTIPRKVVIARVTHRTHIILQRRVLEARALTPIPNHDAEAEGKRRAVMAARVVADAADGAEAADVVVAVVVVQLRVWGAVCGGVV
jgi:hypothetical protein